MNTVVHLKQVSRHLFTKMPSNPTKHFLYRTGRLTVHYVNPYMLYKGDSKSVPVTQAKDHLSSSNPPIPCAH